MAFRPVPRLEVNFEDDPLQSHPAYLQSLGPLGFWRLNELTGTNANDLGSANLDGTYTGGYTLGATGPFYTSYGDIDTAVTLNGTTGYVETAASSVWQNLIGPWTISAWIYPTAARSGGSHSYAGIVCCQSAGGGLGDTPFVFAYGADGFLGPAASRVWAGYFDNGAIKYTQDTAAATLNTWTFYVATFDATTISIYKNGALVVSGATGGAAANAAAAAPRKLYVGRDDYFGGADSFFPGRIDEPAVWNRVLTENEISNLYRYRTIRPATEANYVDLSSRLRDQVQVRRGRSDAASRVEAGTGTATLDNRDGYLLPPPVVNLLANPSFEHPDEPNQPFVVTGGTKTIYGALARLGSRSLQVTATAGSGVPVYATTQRTGLVGMRPGKTYTFSAYILLSSTVGTSVPLTDVSLELVDEVAGAQQITSVAVTVGAYNGWYRGTVTRTIRSNADAAYCRVVLADGDAGKCVFIDTAQLEEASSATAYCDGDQTGCWWSGEPHQSLSHRAAIPATTLTLSGNEITDAVRAANVQGDGLPTDGSFGIWEATTNLVSNGGFETNLTGWGHVNGGGGGTPSRITTGGKFGTCALQIVNTNAGADNYEWIRVTASPSTQYTISVWARTTAFTAPAVANRGLWAIPAISGAPTGGAAQTNVTAAIPGWERHTVTVTTTASANQVEVRLYAPQGTILYDGVQIEQQPIATPYVHTDGATATRAAARVQAPATLIDRTQGWVAMRLRYGWSSTAEPGAGGLFDRAFAWQVDGSNLIQVMYYEAVNQWLIQRSSAGANTTANSAALTFAKDDLATLVCAWTATQLKLSLNGAVFTVAANAFIPAGTTPALFDIGNAGGGNHGDLDFLWFACGTGTLTDQDAARLHALGNTDPAPTMLPAAAQTSMVWPAATATTSSTLRQVVPMRRFRLGATWEGSTYWLLQGYVEAFSYTFPDAVHNAHCVLRLTDGTRVLAAQSMRGFTRTSERPGDRLRAILTYAGIPAADIDIDDDYIAGGAVRAESVTDDTSALALIREIEETEHGVFFFSRAGKFTYQGSEFRTTETLEQFVLNKGDTLLEVPYADLAAHLDVATIANQTAIQNVQTSTTNVYTEQLSQQRFFQVSASESSQWQDGTTSYMDRSTPYPYADSVEVFAETDPTRLWPMILNLELGALGRVERIVNGRDLFAGYLQYLEGVELGVPPSNPWRISLLTTPTLVAPIAATPWQTPVSKPILLTSKQAFGAGTPIAMPTASYTTGRLYVIYAGLWSTVGTTPVLPTITSGNTWTNLDNVSSAGIRHATWYTVATSTVTEALSLAFAGQAANANYDVVILEIREGFNAVPIGDHPGVQTGGQTLGAVDVGTLTDSRSVTLLGILKAAAATPTLSGSTFLYSRLGGSTSYHVAYGRVPDTDTITVDWLGVANGWGGVAIEVQAK